MRFIFRMTISCLGECLNTPPPPPFLSRREAEEEEAKRKEAVLKLREEEIHEAHVKVRSVTHRERISVSRKRSIIRVLCSLFRLYGYEFHSHCRRKRKLPACSYHDFVTASPLSTTDASSVMRNHLHMFACRMWRDADVIREVNERVFAIISAYVLTRTSRMSWHVVKKRHVVRWNN